MPHLPLRSQVCVAFDCDGLKALAPPENDSSSAFVYGAATVVAIALLAIIMLQARAILRMREDLEFAWRARAEQAETLAEKLALGMPEGGDIELADIDEATPDRLRSNYDDVMEDILANTPRTHLNPRRLSYVPFTKPTATDESTLDDDAWSEDTPSVAVSTVSLSGWATISSTPHTGRDPASPRTWSSLPPRELRGAAPPAAAVDAVLGEYSPSHRRESHFANYYAQRPKSLTGKAKGKAD